MFVLWNFLMMKNRKLDDGISFYSTIATLMSYTFSQKIKILNFK